MYLEQLVYDRTERDLINDTDKAYISYIDLNRVENACKELAEILDVKIKVKTWEMTDYRTVKEMERIRSNIQTLVDAFYLPSTSPPLPYQIDYLSIYEANDIERIIHDLWFMYKSSMEGMRRCAFKLGVRTIGNRGD